jgi:hypothetical protein
MFEEKETPLHKLLIGTAFAFFLNHKLLPPRALQVKTWKNISI